LKLPSWKEFEEKVSKFELQVNDKITKGGKDLSNRHPLIATAFKASLHVLPPPFDGITESLYDSFTGSDEEKLEEVKRFLDQLQRQGEHDYEEMASRLDAFRLDIIYLKNSAAKQSTLLQIKDIMISRDNTINQKLDKLLNNQEELLKGANTGSRQNTLMVDPKPRTFYGEKRIFINRQNFLDQIKKYFESSNYPISITSMGGMGKSALAFKAIHECEDMFDLIIPVYFAEAGISLNSFLSSIAKRFNIQMNKFDAMEPLDRREYLINNLGRSNTHPLIFADNYETVSAVLKSPSKDAEQINGFLQSVPDNTAIILTSRLRRNIAGEREIQLDALSLEDGTRLFIKVGGAGLENRPKMQKAIENLVNKTGRHPLSIEILAKSYNGSGLQEIEKMLESLGLDVPNPAEEQEHLRSLDACFGYSINNLDECLRELLHKLVLFKSPFPSSAASEIFGVIKIDVLNLYNRSLLISINPNEGDKIVEEDYLLYSFHPAIRNFLEGKAKKKYPNLEKEYAEKFVGYYLKLLQETDAAYGKENYVLVIKQFDIIREVENNDFDRAKSLSSPQIAADISILLGLILYKAGRFSIAVEYHTRSLEIHRSLNDRPRMAYDYKNIGVAVRENGNLKESLENHKQALSIDEDLNDKAAMSSDYANIGNTLRNMSQLPQSLKNHEKALAIDAKRKDRSAVSNDYTNIGNVFNDMGKLEQALEYHRNALKIDKDELNDKTWMAVDYSNIGIVLDDMGNFKDALEHHQKALAIDKDEHNDRVRMAKDYTNMGNTLYDMGNFKDALEHHQKALAIDEETRYEIDMAKDYNNIGNVLAGMRSLKEAQDNYEKSKSIFEKLEDRIGAAREYNHIANVLYDMGNSGEAITYYKKAIEIDPEYGITYDNMSYALYTLKDYSAAIEYSDKAIEIDPEYGNAWYNRACYRIKNLDIDNGLADLKKAIDIDKQQYTEFAKQDEDFKSVSNEERFKVLIST
jgi:tetratricopeptide (TPR) repeat protein